MRTVASTKLTTTDDVTFQLTIVALWTYAEISSGIIAGCLPVLPALFRHFVPKMTSTFNSYSRRIRASKNCSLNTQHTSQWSSSGVYVELDDKKRPLGIRSPHAENAITSTVETDGHTDDLESGVRGIRKTTSIEQSSC